LTHSRLETVRDQVRLACEDAGRDPTSVQLIAVSKTQPEPALRAAFEAGQSHFGESYAQELRDKARALDGIRWHFIGRLQRNKIKYVAPVAHRVHALETEVQAQALAARAPAEISCLLSVNIAHEESKGGVLPGAVLDRCRSLHQVSGIRLVGLMCLPPFNIDPEASAPWFQQMADLAARGRADGLPLHELSMGMSNDFGVAIRHGATWVRVGTAIFGPRQR
jgi:PLP dependent protein